MDKNIPVKEPFTKEEKKILRYLHRLGIRHDWQIRQFFLGPQIAHDALNGKSMDSEKVKK